MNGKRLLLISLHGRDSGGGSAFLEQSMHWGVALGMQCIWLSFLTFNNQPYAKDNIEYTENFGTYVELSGGFSTINVSKWLNFLRPDIIHHQGHKRREICELASLHNIPIITGIHFWNGVLNLHPLTYNTKIDSNLDKHAIAAEFCHLLEFPNVYWYCCSDYVLRIIQHYMPSFICPIMYPSSSEKLHKVDRKGAAAFISQVNIHEKKGGEIFLYILKQLGEKYDFMAVQCEPYSEQLDRKIESTMKLFPAPPRGHVFRNYTRNIAADVYRHTKILLLPTLVDETFCRTAFEAMCNGIPIITTGNGFVRELVGDAAIILPENNYELWVEAVVELCENQEHYKVMSEKCKLRSMYFSDTLQMQKFETILQKVCAARKNVAIFAPFCAQGLGIQTLNYCQFLKHFCNPFVFSYKPYNAANAKKLQSEELEWQVDGVSVYYSQNDRENVTNDELEEFVRVNRIKIFIIPETCWNRVFEIAKFLRARGLIVIGVPNIEIVRKDELDKHAYFDKLLCSNLWSYETLKNEFRMENVEYLGYSVYPTMLPSKAVPISDGRPIRFLALGGMNAIHRKQTHKIAAAFDKISRNFHLTITIQMHQLYDLKLLDQFANKEPRITIVRKNFSNAEIRDLYMQHDVSLQLSSHEGIGLQFYESLAYGIPVISLDAFPHKEIIKPNESGWLLPSKEVKLRDNPQAIINGAQFEVEDLVNLLETITQDEICKIQEKLRQNITMIPDTDFMNRFKCALEI